MAGEILEPERTGESSVDYSAMLKEAQQETPDLSKGGKAREILATGLVSAELKGQSVLPGALKEMAQEGVQPMGSVDKSQDPVDAAAREAFQHKNANTRKI